jgi:hypothetical protein
MYAARPLRSGRALSLTVCDLQQEYCPPIDPALFYAFYSDFKGEPNAIELLKNVLDSMKADAEVQALSGFDPSASSGGPVHDSPGKHSADADSNADTWATQTVSTDLSNDISTLSLGERSGGSEGSNDGGYYKDTAEHFDVQTKEQLLAETFPDLSFQKVIYTLKKCGYDYDKATDELLNHVFFEDTRTSPGEGGPIARGIDAFSEDHHVPQRGKKGKGKKKKLTLAEANASYFVESDVPTNRWQNTKRDVDFVTSRTGVPQKTVSSIYHEKGASLSATVLAIARKDIEAHKKDVEPDPALVQDALTLNADYPTMDLMYALALVRLTSPSITNARALAKALTQQPASETGGKGGINLDQSISRKKTLRQRNCPHWRRPPDRAMSHPPPAPVARRSRRHLACIDEAHRLHS